MNLSEVKEEWFALAEPVEVFTFDFYDYQARRTGAGSRRDPRPRRPQANISPLERQIEFPLTKSGVFNAVAFWFELQLDEDTSYSTSPYVEQGKTWQQAVQARRPSARTRETGTK